MPKVLIGQTFIGRQIRRAREEKNWDQKTLAEQFKPNKRSAASISLWERGLREPRWHDLNLLARILGKPIAFFADPGYEERERLRMEPLQTGGYFLGRKVLVQFKLEEHHGMTDRAFTCQGVIKAFYGGFMEIGTQSIPMNHIQVIHFLD